MKTPIALAVAVSTAVVATVAAAPAQAIDYWNDYEITGLPEYITGATPFDVTVAGSNPVCQMTFLDETLTSAPWTFTYQPFGDNPFGDNPFGVGVEVTQCDGQEDWVPVTATTAFEFTGEIMGPGQSLAVHNNSDTSATVTLRTGDGRELRTTELPAHGVAQVTLPNRARTTQTYRVDAVSNDGGLSMEHRVVVPKGWSPLMQGVGAAFPCGTVTWAYDPKGAPKGTSKVVKDIEGSFKRLAKETGLDFTRLALGSEADITYSWRNLGHGSTGGRGGFQWSSTGRSVGHVRLNTQSSWTRDKQGGFAGSSTYKTGPAGRGWLIIHETMHALGFGHVGDEKSVMAPFNRGQAKFTKHDVAGLRAMYPCRVDTPGA